MKVDKKSILACTNDWNYVYEHDYRKREEKAPLHRGTQEGGGGVGSTERTDCGFVL